MTEDIPLQELSRRLAQQPDLWPAVRDGVRATFAGMARDWEARLGADHLAPLEAALDRVGRASRALDLGTGTGLAARLVADRFPGAAVVGLDLAEEMVREAVVRSQGSRIGYLAGDGSALPFSDDAFDLITAVNVFVFWGEATRALRDGGALAIAYSNGEHTPIFVPVADVRRHLSAAGPFEIDDGRTGRGIWILARRAGQDSNLRPAD